MGRRRREKVKDRYDKVHQVVKGELTLLKCSNMTARLGATLLLSSPLAEK